jgi:hypothetical protein
MSQISERNQSPIHDKPSVSKVKFSDDTDFSKPTPKSTTKSKRVYFKVKRNAFTSDESNTEEENNFGISGNAYTSPKSPNNFFTPVISKIQSPQSTAEVKSFSNPKQASINKTENILTDKKQDTENQSYDFQQLLANPQQNLYLENPTHHPIGVNSSFKSISDMSTITDPSSFSHNDDSFNTEISDLSFRITPMTKPITTPISRREINDDSSSSNDISLPILLTTTLKKPKAPINYDSSSSSNFSEPILLTTTLIKPKAPPPIIQSSRNSEEYPLRKVIELRDNSVLAQQQFDKSYEISTRRVKGTKTNETENVIVYKKNNTKVPEATINRFIYKHSHPFKKTG